MKVVRINGKAAKVFVLKETEESLVYIPVNSIQRVDYERLLEIEKRGGEMLNEMRKTKLDNGMNALTLYDEVISVLRYNKDHTDSVRVPKPTEGQSVHVAYEERMKKLEEENQKSQPVQQKQEASEEEKPKKRRGPGRPPKSETKQDDE